MCVPYFRLNSYFFVFFFVFFSTLLHFLYFILSLKLPLLHFQDHFSLACLQCMTMECKSLVLAIAYLSRLIRFDILYSFFLFKYPFFFLVFINLSFHLSIYRSIYQTTLYRYHKRHTHIHLLCFYFNRYSLPLHSFSS